MRSVPHSGDARTCFPTARCADKQWWRLLVTNNYAFIPQQAGARPHAAPSLEVRVKLRL